MANRMMTADEATKLTIMADEWYVQNESSIENSPSSKSYVNALPEIVLPCSNYTYLVEGMLLIKGKAGVTNTKGLKISWLQSDVSDEMQDNTLRVKAEIYDNNNGYLGEETEKYLVPYDAPPSTYDTQYFISTATPLTSNNTAFVTFRIIVQTSSAVNDAKINIRFAPYSVGDVYTISFRTAFAKITKLN